MSIEKRLHTLNTIDDQYSLESDNIPYFRSQGRAHRIAFEVGLEHES